MNVPVEHRDQIAARPPPTAREPITVVLLFVGQLLFGLGWIVGVILLRISPFWRLRDKILGTLVVPGGLPMGLLVAIFGAQPILGHPYEPSLATRILVGAVQTFVVFGPIYTAFHLARRIIQAWRRRPLAGRDQPGSAARHSLTE